MSYNMLHASGAGNNEAHDKQVCKNSRLMHMFTLLPKDDNFNMKQSRTVIRTVRYDSHKCGSDRR